MEYRPTLKRLLYLSLALIPIGPMDLVASEAAQSAKVGPGYIWAFRASNENSWTIQIGDQLDWQAPDKCSEQVSECKIPRNLWPKSLQNSKKLWVLTPSGLELAAPQSLEVNPVGVLEIKAERETPPSSGSPKKGKSFEKQLSAELIEGLARIEKPFPPGANLLTIKRAPVDSSEISEIQKKLHVWVTQKTRSESKRFSNFKIKASDYNLARFKSSRGDLWLAWLSRSIEDTDAFVFAALVNDAGQIVETFMAPTTGSYPEIEQWEPKFFADFSGDGIPAIVAEKPYYEGTRVIIYSLKKSKGFEESVILVNGV